MGYDMHVCDNDGAALDTTYEDNRYLRRSIGTQGPLRDALERAGMAFWPVTEPTFPDYPGDVHFRDFEAVTEEGREYRRLTDEALVKVYDERPGISLHKLVYNNGWWVTAVECRTALQLWERAGCPMDEEFRDDVIPFLREAAINGGFRVY